MLDGSKAYNRVQPFFLQKVLEAYGFPPEFRDLISILFFERSFQLKINGVKGESIPDTNSVRQGCCLAPSLYALVHEVFLRMIRHDKQLKGIRIPDRDGQPDGPEMRERAFADDTGVALAGYKHLDRLFELMRSYCHISGAEFNEKKTIGIRLGPLRWTPPPAKYAAAETGASGRFIRRWYRYGIDPLPLEDRYLGIRPGGSEEVAAQWEAKINELELEITNAMAQGAPRTTFGRSLWIKARLFRRGD